MSNTIETKKIEILLEQRAQLVKNIEVVNKALHTLYLTIIAAMASLSVLLNTTLTLIPFTAFIVTQFIFLSVMFVLGLLFSETMIGIISEQLMII